MNFTLECDQEVDGCWIAEVPELPRVLSYGNSAAAAAMAKAGILALRVIADRLENSETEPVSISLRSLSGHESLAIGQSEKGVGCTPVHRLAGKAIVRIS